MTAHRPITAESPARIPADYPSDDCCDCCCAVPVVEVIDGDRMCQACADRWCRAQRPDDDLLPLDHPAMREALDDWHAKYGIEPARILKEQSCG